MVLRARMAGNSEPVQTPEAKPLLFVISGPSGVGKDALVDVLKQHEPERHYTITATTRGPRQGEVNGTHYHFWGDERFKEQINDGELLEWAKVYDHYYGVPKVELRDAVRQNLDVILKVDVQGAASIKKLLPQAVLIFLAPFSIDELLQRHYRRHTETPEELRLRMETAHTEMAAMEYFDYTVINKQGELTRAVAQVESIITAEKCRVKPNIFSL